MAFDHKDDSGSLFKNTKKESENHPDYTGSGKIGGKEYWLNAWLKTTKNGQKFFSFSFREKVAATMDQRTETSEVAPIDEDSIPF